MLDALQRLQLEIRSVPGLAFIAVFYGRVDFQRDSPFSVLICFSNSSQLYGTMGLSGTAGLIISPLLVGTAGGGSLRKDLRPEVTKVFIWGRRKHSLNVLHCLKLVVERGLDPVIHLHKLDADIFKDHGRQVQ